MDGIDDDTDDGPQFIVCVLASVKAVFSDDVLGSCQFCERAVRHRPHVPTPNRLICMECFAERAEEGDEIMFTEKTIREFLNKMRH
jgi:hypothetical protein